MAIKNLNQVKTENNFFASYNGISDLKESSYNKSTNSLYQKSKFK